MITHQMAADLHNLNRPGCEAISILALPLAYP